MIIYNLDNNKAAGPDNINNRILKAASDIISEPLSHFFNRCIAAGIFPKCWKLAHSTPIHKKGPLELLINYRPISLISCIGNF